MPDGTRTADRDHATLSPLLRRAAELAASVTRVVGLIDPALPPLAPALRARLSQTVPDAYAASLLEPDALLCPAAPASPSLAPLARLLLDPALPRDAPPAPVAPGLPAATERFWRAPRPAAPTPRPGRPTTAVLTQDRTAPLALALARAGAALLPPGAVAAHTPRFRRVLYLLDGADPAPLHLLRTAGGDAVLTEAAVDAPPALLADALAHAARLFVHTPALAAAIAARHGREPALLPPAADGRQFVATAAGLWAECCVWALEILASWGETVRLVLRCPAAERPALVALAHRLRVADRLSLAPAPPAATLHLTPDDPDRAPRPPIATSATATPGALLLPDQPSPPLLAEALLGLLPPHSPADDAARLLLHAIGAR